MRFRRPIAIQPGSSRAGRQPLVRRNERKQDRPHYSVGRYDRVRDPDGQQPSGRRSIRLDGNVWFTEQIGNKIGRITTGGTFTEFPVPTAACQPQGVASGPDGNIWFTEQTGSKIGRITTGGKNHRVCAADA